MANTDRGNFLLAAEDKRSPTVFYPSKSLKITRYPFNWQNNNSINFPNNILHFLKKNMLFISKNNSCFCHHNFYVLSDSMYTCTDTHVLTVPIHMCLLYRYTCAYCTFAGQTFCWGRDDLLAEKCSPA